MAWPFDGWRRTLSHRSRGAVNERGLNEKLGVGVELAVQVIVALVAASLFLLGYVVQRPTTRLATAPA